MIESKALIRARALGTKSTSKFVADKTTPKLQTINPQKLSATKDHFKKFIKLINIFDSIVKMDLVKYKYYFL